MCTCVLWECALYCFCASAPVSQYKYFKNDCELPQMRISRFLPRFHATLKSSLRPNLINEKTIIWTRIWTEYREGWILIGLLRDIFNTHRAQKNQLQFWRHQKKATQDSSTPVLYLCLPAASPYALSCNKLDSQVSEEPRHAYFIHPHPLVMYGGLGRYTHSAAVCLSNGGGDSSDYRQRTTLMLL